MLFAGLSKVGSQPATATRVLWPIVRAAGGGRPAGEHHRRVARLDPHAADGEAVAPEREAATQRRERPNRLSWMDDAQPAERTVRVQGLLAWQCTVEKLFDTSQPKPPHQGQGGIPRRSFGTRRSRVYDRRTSARPSESERRRTLEPRRSRRFIEAGRHRRRSVPLRNCPAGYQDSRRDAGVRLLRRTSITSWASAARCRPRFATRWRGPTFPRSIR